MTTLIQKISIERLKNDEANQLIENFISIGWEYHGNWEFSSHIFAKFIWDKDTEPIYPEGYQ